MENLQRQQRAKLQLQLEQQQQLASQSQAQLSSSANPGTGREEPARGRPGGSPAPEEGSGEQSHTQMAALAAMRAAAAGLQRPPDSPLMEDSSEDEEEGGDEQYKDMMGSEEEEHMHSYALILNSGGWFSALYANRRADRTQMGRKEEPLFKNSSQLLLSGVLMEACIKDLTVQARERTDSQCSRLRATASEDNGALGSLQAIPQAPGQTTGGAEEEGGGSVAGPGRLTGHSMAVQAAAAAQAAMSAQVAALEQLRDQVESGEPPEKKMALMAEEQQRLMQRALQQNLLAMTTAHVPMNIRINNQESRRDSALNLTANGTNSIRMSVELNGVVYTGTPVNRIPIMAKQVLDLYMLYMLVTEKGGLVEVINKKLWREITKGLNLPTSITSAAFTLRTQYMKYLYPYECEKRSLSNPNELQAAIDSNRREGRRQGFGGTLFTYSPNGTPTMLSSPKLPLPSLSRATNGKPLAPIQKIKKEEEGGGSVAGPGRLTGHSMAVQAAAAAQAAMSAQVAALEQLRDQVESGEPPEKKMALVAEEQQRLMQRALQQNLLAMTTTHVPMNIRINNQESRRDSALNLTANGTNSIRMSVELNGVVYTAHQLPAPSVVVFQPSEEELFKGTATLVCLVSKLSGALVDISWTANETAVTSEVPSSRPSRESDGTFSVSSCLTISAAEWREDRVYSCIVQQGASLTQRSIQQSRC
ncbi:UNVERIFIED_CONTAM: hypothetical protein FKN15_030886 [Acipenser sinensis]